jgi:hypothetical protein
MPLATLWIVGKPWMSKGAMRWFHNVPMVKKLWNIKQFFHWKFIYIQKERGERIWACSWYAGKGLNEEDIMKVIWKFLDLRCDIEYSIHFFIAYWTNFSLKIHSNKKLEQNLDLLLIFLETPQWVGFNESDSEILRPKVQEILNFG